MRARDAKCERASERNAECECDPELVRASERDAECDAECVRCRVRAMPSPSERASAMPMPM